MRPTYMGFEVQKRTLQLAQKNIDIVGNNVSNINTPGYTRQRVDLYSEYVSVNSSFRWASPNANLSMQGQGVNAYGVSQIRDIYIDRRYRENVAIEAETEKNVSILSDIEDTLSRTVCSILHSSSSTQCRDIQWKSPTAATLQR